MIDAAALARDTAAVVQVPSITGDERAALERLGELAEALGLDAELHGTTSPRCAATRTTPARRRRATSSSASP